MKSMPLALSSTGTVCRRKKVETKDHESLPPILSLNKEKNQPTAKGSINPCIIGIVRDMTCGD